MTRYSSGMTRKITVSLPDDVAARLEREPNVSAFITEAVRGRMTAEIVRRKLIEAGFNITDEGVARVQREHEEAMARLTPEFHREAEALAKRIRAGIA